MTLEYHIYYSRTAKVCVLVLVHLAGQERENSVLGYSVKNP